MFNTDLSTHRFPGIARAALEMAYDNGGINRMRSEQDALRDLDAILTDGADIAFDLPDIDRWLASLSDDDLQTVVAGEETEAAQIIANAPGGTHQILEDIFERAA
jgi:hypothetical protein